MIFFSWNQFHEKFREINFTKKFYVSLLRSKENWESNFDKAQKTKALFNDFIKSPPLKSLNAEQKSEESSKKLFVLDTQGNPELLKKRKQETEMDIESTNNSELPVEKKKKKSKKSYLDDL